MRFLEGGAAQDPDAPHPPRGGGLHVGATDRRAWLAAPGLSSSSSLLLSSLELSDTKVYEP